MQSALFHLGDRSVHQCPFRLVPQTNMNVGSCPVHLHHFSPLSRSAREAMTIDNWQDLLGCTTEMGSLLVLLSFRSRRYRQCSLFSTRVTLRNSFLSGRKFRGTLFHSVSTDYGYTFREKSQRRQTTSLARAVKSQIKCSKLLLSKNYNILFMPFCNFLPILILSSEGSHVGLYAHFRRQSFQSLATHAVPHRMGMDKKMRSYSHAQLTQSPQKSRRRNRKKYVVRVTHGARTCIA